MAFAGMGAQAAVVPAVLPVWSQRAGDGVLAAVPAMFAGLVVGVLTSVPLLARLGTGRVLRGSAAAQALALVGLAAVGRGMTAGSVRVAVVVAAAAGVAFGVTESATSLAARTAAGTDRRLGRLLAISAATAAVLPVLVFAATRVGGAEAALLVAAAAPLLVALRPAVPAPASPGRARAVRTPGVARILVPAGIALALYVGVETVLSGWSAVLTHDLLGADPALAALGASAFWLLMSAGRAWGSRTRGGMTARALLAAGLFALAAGGGRVPAGVAGACAATVLVIAPAYPRLLGAALDRLDGPSAARWTGPLVAAGASGGSLLPALVLRLGSPSDAATFVSAAVACLALALVARPLAAPLTSPSPPPCHEQAPPAGGEWDPEA